MYICICNKITEEDLISHPDLINIKGTKCGKCVSDVGEIGSTDYENVTENRQGESRRIGGNRALETRAKGLHST